MLVWWDHGRLLRYSGLIFDEVSAGVFAGATQPSVAELQMPEFRWEG